MENKYQFETLRLRFRQWEEEDKIPFARMNANIKVMEYFPSMLTSEQSDELITRISNHFKDHGYGLWAVELKETNEFIGFIGFLNATFESSFTPCIEIGWRIDDKFWNKGYATEGASACLEYGFNTLKMKEIYSFTSQLNKRSINVMKKIGLEEKGVFYHPRIEEGNPLRLHVLYKIDKKKFDKVYV
ncbi:MAG: family acetyltransferase [Clostridia bacterium]|nr:family acetyltransferase [Clostridia bacterium]